MMENLELKLSTRSNKENLAIAYIRVSTKEQKKEGHSLESQENHIRDYVSKNNLELIDVVKESKSASKVSFDNNVYENSLYSALKTRPKLLKIISSANKTKFKHLIVSTRDRLARNLELFVSIKYFLMKRGIELHFANPNESIHMENSGLQDFIELIFGSVAELEANLISDRVRDGMAQKVRKGYWPGGHPPYGYTTKEVVLDNGKTQNVLEPLLIEQKYVEEIFKLHNQYGFSYRKIARILNDEYDTSIWNKSKVENIINNETYTGKLTWGRRSRKKINSPSNNTVRSSKGDFKGFVSNKEWEQAKMIRTKKSQVKDPKYYSTPFLLRDKLICGKCGNDLKAKNYGYDRKGNPREGVYRCDCTKNLSKDEKMVIKKSILEDKFIDEFLSNLAPNKVDILWGYYSITKNKTLKENTDDIANIDREISLKDEKLSKLNDLINSKKEDKDNESQKKEPVKDLLKISKLEELIKALKYQRTLILREISMLNSYKKELKSISSKSFKDKEALMENLKQLFTTDFQGLSQERKRMLIDILIEKIVVHKSHDELKLAIYMTTDIQIL